MHGRSTFLKVAMFPFSNKIVGKSSIFLYRFWIRLANKIFNAAISGAFRHFGVGSVIQFPVTLWGESGISVGEKVHIGPGSWLLCLRDSPTAREPVIEIGDGCSFAGGVTVTAVLKVCFENEVLIGRNVHISDHAHEFGSKDIAILHQGVSGIKPVRIGAGSWLGQGVVVCPGVAIGRNCVIGANSVVNSDIPDGCVAVGAPARIVRRPEGSGPAPDRESGDFIAPKD